MKESLATTLSNSDLLRLAYDDSLTGRAFLTEEAGRLSCGIIANISVQNHRSIVITLQEQMHFKMVDDRFAWKKGCALATYFAPDEWTSVRRREDGEVVIAVPRSWLGRILPAGTTHPPRLLRN